MSLEEPEKAPIEPLAHEGSFVQDIDTKLPDTLIEQTDQPVIKAESESIPQVEVVTPKISVCAVCEEKESKYKCSRCYLP